MPSWDIQGKCTPAKLAPGIRDFLRYVDSLGSHIVIFTARFDPSWQDGKPWTKGFRHNMSKFLEDLYKYHTDIIGDYMIKHALPYHEISTCKPLAHFYIDDRSWNPVSGSFEQIKQTMQKLSKITI